MRSPMRQRKVPQVSTEEPLTIKGWVQTDLTEDLKKFDVRTLILPD